MHKTIIIKDKQLYQYINIYIYIYIYIYNYIFQIIKLLIIDLFIDAKKDFYVQHIHNKYNIHLNVVNILFITFL